MICFFIADQQNSCRTYKATTKKEGRASSRWPDRVYDLKGQSRPLMTPDRVIVYFKRCFRKRPFLESKQSKSRFRQFFRWTPARPLQLAPLKCSSLCVACANKHLMRYKCVSMGRPTHRMYTCVHRHCPSRLGVHSLECDSTASRHMSLKRRHARVHTCTCTA